ncbi:MAG TPA: fumarylacetoacetate hydrolase family protein [Ramlibacter sp.]|nr:fumarylacetoacetate hydrolase family protein [Ramlibacter sp.]
MRPPEAPTTGPQAVARALLQARRRQAPVESAALERLLLGPDDAYETQELVAREGGWHPDGVPRYWKSGGPRPGQLTHAPLPEPGVWPSPADARGRHFNFRLIEAEVALKLARDVSAEEAAGLQTEQANALVAAMTVSIEIVDSRWTEGVRTAALLKLADLQSHGALALGEWRPFQARDWAQQTCVVQIGGATPQTFRGTHSLGDPAWLLPTWLRHVTRHGATVPRGTVVTTGTWCGMLPAQAGDHVRAVFEGIGEAAVRL